MSSPGGGSHGSGRGDAPSYGFSSPATARIVGRGEGAAPAPTPPSLGGGSGGGSVSTGGGSEGGSRTTRIPPRAYLGVDDAEADRRIKEREREAASSSSAAASSAGSPPAPIPMPIPISPQPGGRRSLARLEGDYAAGTAPSGEKGAEAGALGDAAARGAAAALTEAPARSPVPLPPPPAPGLLAQPGVSGMSDLTENEGWEPMGQRGGAKELEVAQAVPVVAELVEVTDLHGGGMVYPHPDADRAKPAADGFSLSLRDRRVQLCVGLAVLVVGGLLFGLGYSLTRGGGAEAVPAGAAGGSGSSFAGIGAPADPTGEEACEMRGLGRNACLSQGCCKWDGGECYSAVEDAPCRSPVGSQPPRPTRAPTGATGAGPAWRPFGPPIVGEALGDEFGSSVSLSADGLTVAIGAPYHRGPGLPKSSGRIRVVRWDGTGWTKVGQPIDGTERFEALGTGDQIALSADGEVLAVGSPQIDLYRGVVRVYDLDGGNGGDGVWIQRGAPIKGELEGEGAGYAVALSADGNIVAIVSADYTPFLGPELVGRVRGFFWEDENLDENLEGSWELGGEIVGDRVYGHLSTVALSEDRIAVGGSWSDGKNGAFTGHVKVYELEDQTDRLEQIGEDLEGEREEDEFGHSVALSSDGSVLAVGSVMADSGRSGGVRVFLWNDQGLNWEPMGQPLQGDGRKDWFGHAVALSADGMILAASAADNLADDFGDGKASWEGYTKAFRFDEDTSQWKQLGETIYDEVSGDGSGFAIDLSADGTLLAIGGPRNSDRDWETGHVRVFKFS